MYMSKCINCGRINGFSSCKDKLLGRCYECGGALEVVLPAPGSGEDEKGRPKSENH